MRIRKELWQRNAKSAMRHPDHKRFSLSSLTFSSLLLKNKASLVRGQKQWAVPLSPFANNPMTKHAPYPPSSPSSIYAIVHTPNIIYSFLLLSFIHRSSHFVLISLPLSLQIYIYRREPSSTSEPALTKYIVLWVTQRYTHSPMCHSAITV